jgi:type IV secretion system protein VirB4
MPGARRFLVRQGLQGVVCELDLEGFEAELAVISGRARNVQRVEQLIAEYGEAPEQWLPVFRAEAETAR